MRIFTLRRTQFINIAINEAWSFFSDPKNLAAITPPWLDFQINQEVPDKIYPGMIIKYKVRPLFGLNINWITEITHINEPDYFVDEQRFGPYKFWHHEHHLFTKGSGTEIEDIIHYGHFGGILVNKFIIAKQLEKIFDFRFKYLDEKFNGLKRTA